MIDRAAALDLLRSLSPEPHLIQHAFATEAIMRALASLRGEDVELWGLTGLLHDLDFPLTKDTIERHGIVSAERLEGLLPSEGCHAILAHNAECTGVAATSSFDTALRCSETVTGLVITAALVRPTGLDGMESKSLKKKMKDRAFAASVNRDWIRECENIGMDLDAFLTLSIAALVPIGKELGIAKS